MTLAPSTASEEDRGGDWCYPGARWWKFDLHTHTPASRDYGKGPRQAALRGISPKEWLLGFMRAGVDCVAVTDHNSGDWIDPLKHALQELQSESHADFRPLHLFPGMEITANGGAHVLAILDLDRSSADVATLLGSVGYRRERGRATRRPSSPRAASPRRSPRRAASRFWLTSTNRRAPGHWPAVRCRRCSTPRSSSSWRSSIPGARSPICIVSGSSAGRRFWVPTLTIRAAVTGLASRGRTIRGSRWLHRLWRDCVSHCWTAAVFRSAAATIPNHSTRGRCRSTSSRPSKSRTHGTWGAAVRRRSLSVRGSTHWWEGAARASRRSSTRCDWRRGASES